MKNKNISKNNLFITFGIFFLMFTFIGNIINNVFVSVFVLLLLIIMYLNLFIYIKKYLIIIVFITIGGSFGLLSSHIANEVISEKLKLLEPYYDYKYNVSGEIIGVNKIKDFESEYIIKLIEISRINNINYGNFLSLQENIIIKGLITIPSNFDIKKGDIIQFSEKFQKIENFNNNFDYEKYYQSKNIYFKVNAGSINNIGNVQANFIIYKIDNIRQILLDKINKLYPKEEAIFLGGILLGARESMPDNLKTNFNNSGLTHFIAVSGFNITILIIFISYLLKIFPKFVRVILITLSIAVFVILVGDSVSVLRASIMGLVGYYIMISGRNGNNFSILIFVGIIMILISPLSITYDISLHLSFLAVLGILYTQNFFQKIFYWLPNFLAIKEAFILTLSAMTFALPIIMFNFGQLSIMSPLANIAVTWTIPLAMLGGFLSICVDFVYHELAIWISYFTWVLLAWDIKIVHFFGGLDWAIVKADLGIYKYSLEILYFIILIFLINFFKKD